MPVWLTFWWAVAAVGVLEAVFSLQGGIRFWRLFRRSCSKAPTAPIVPAVLIIPFKGVDPGLELNLRAFFAQDYADLHYLLVTQDAKDPSVAVIQKIASQYPERRWRLLFTGSAQGQGQKVHNLVRAVGAVEPDREILVFGDSDIRPGKHWTRDLIEVANRPGVGMATGFRWYLPQTHNFASLLRACWNAGIASLMTEKDNRFAWGGAMAIKRTTFERCRVLEYWRGALSDDLALSRALRDCRQSIYFQPRALSFSHEDCSLGELLNWTHRQFAITRIYHPQMWWMTLAAQAINGLTLWGGLGLLLLGSWTGLKYEAVVCVASVTSLVWGLGCLKAACRLLAIKQLFPRQAGRNWWVHVCCGPLCNLLSLLSLARSFLGRTIQWRGIRYRMDSPQRTRVLPCPPTGLKKR